LSSCGTIDSEHCEQIQAGRRREKTEEGRDFYVMTTTTSSDNITGRLLMLITVGYSDTF
jgi:hypothetical protein